jgi:hypothetical protein
MKSYICELCNKEFNRSTNYYRHLNRKIQCNKNSLKFVEILQKSLHNPPKDEKSNIFHSKSSLFPSQNNFEPSKTLQQEEDIFQCEYCDKTFTRKDNLNRHIKLRCKLYKEYKEMNKDDDPKYSKLKDIIKKKDELLNEYKNKEQNHTVNTVNNTLNNSNSNNKIINNITINAFGKEDLSFIKDKDYIKLFESSHEAVMNLTKLIHFNKKQPTNSNVYISNMKDSYVMFYTGIKWELGVKSDIIDNVYDSKLNLLDDKFEELEDEIPKTFKKKYERFIDNTNTSKIVPRIKKKIKLEMYNSRTVAMNHKMNNKKTIK